MANKDKEALALHRQGLKTQLWRDRRDGIPPGQGGMQRPYCAYCGTPIWKADDAVMHEWLIKRSDVPVKLQMAIMHEHNCVLLHVDCHAQYGQTRECKLRCARAQYQRYGRDAMAEWVESLGLKQHVEIPDELEALMAVHDGILDGSIDPGEPEPLPEPRRYIFYTDDY